MEVTKQGSIALLKSAITGEACPLPEDFDLEAAYPVLKKHHMDTLIYEGALCCGISPQSPVMNQLFMRYCRHLQISEGQRRQVKRIFAAFEENGIDYLPLKGCRMKHMYPKPELRYMGDADILIRMEQYPKAAQAMSSLGFTEAGESNHEYIWKHPELYVELHKRVIASYNEDYYGFFGDGWRLASYQEGHCWSMTPEDEWILLLTHFAKHFRGGGIGCRHVVDLWVYLRSNADMDEGYIQAELEKLQLVEFHENVRRVIAAWFEGAEPDEKAKIITDYVFASGSWGGSENRLVSMGTRKSKTLTGTESRLIYLRSAVFPDLLFMQKRYRILKKAPWLLPAVWVYRLVYKLLFEHRRIQRAFNAMDKLTTEKLTTHKQMLSYLGLEFRHK